MPLSDTQLIILSAAAQRDNRMALPLPANLKGGAAQKVVASLVNKGLLQEVDAKPGETCWSQTADGDGMTLLITDAGLAAIGIEPDAPLSTTGGDTCAPTDGVNHDAAATGIAPTAPAGATTRKPREGTKQAALIAMLRAPQGATIDEIVAAIGWRPHSVRGVMSGALKKKLGLTITSEKDQTRGRIYRVNAEA